MCGREGRGKVGRKVGRKVEGGEGDGDGWHHTEHRWIRHYQFAGRRSLCNMTMYLSSNLTNGYT